MNWLIGTRSGDRLRQACSQPITNYLLFLLAVIPIVLACYVQKRFWLNVPIWDEWDTPGIVLVHAAQHQLSWTDLFAQHNESRKFFPRLVYLALATLFGWDVRHGMVLTLLSASAASAFALRYLTKGRGKLVPLVIFPWLLINALLFGPSQYENFLCGNSFEIYVPVLALFACIAVNLSNRPLWQKAGWNSLFALVATYTFAHGMILWILALPIASATEWQLNTRWRRLAVAYTAYALVGVLAVGCYFIGYQRPSIAPPPARFTQLPQLVEFMMVWLGSVLRSNAIDAHVVGAFVGIVLFGAIVLAIGSVFTRKHQLPWRRYYPWLLLAAFSLGSGAITAVGRLNIGIGLVFETGFVGVSSVRYHITAVFAYVAAIGLLWSLSDWVCAQFNWRLRFVIAATAGTTLLAVAWLYTLSTEWTRLRGFAQSRERARTAVVWSGVALENPDLLFAYPYSPNFPQRVAEMRHLRILRLPTISAKIASAVQSLPETTTIEGGNLDSAGGSGGAEFRVTGWARNPRRNVRADTVVLGWEESGSFHPLVIARTGNGRPDVAEALHAPSLSKAGFDHQFDLGNFGRTALRLRAWAVDSATEEVFPIHGSVLLPPKVP